MDIIKEELNENIYIPKALHEDLFNKNICFLDIETTGLSGKYNEVILIGLLYIEQSSVYVIQLFANDPLEEYDLLISFKSFLNKFDYIITYNGNSFDIPFLKKRFEFHDLVLDIDEIPHIDLLKLVKKNKAMLKLEDCKLKTVETALNIFRKDTISGKESVKLYKEYVYSKQKDKKDIILRHNYDDIFYLPKLLSIYDIIEFESILSLNTLFNGIEICLDIHKPLLQFKHNVLSIICTSSTIDLPSQVYYKDFYSLNWNTKDGDLNIDLNYKTALLSSGEKCAYIDLSESEFSLISFDSRNYTIPDDILLLKVNDDIVYENIVSLTSHIIYSLE